MSRSIALVSSLVSIFTVGAIAGCAVDATAPGEVALTTESTHVHSTNGFTPGTQILTTDPARHCTIDKVHGALTWLAAQPPAAQDGPVLDFINTNFSDPSTSLQCSPCEVQIPVKGTMTWVPTMCLDIVDRQPLGAHEVHAVESPAYDSFDANYLVGFVPDLVPSDWSKWDGIVAANAAPPVSASTTGYISYLGTTALGKMIFEYTHVRTNAPYSRAIKFDPRGCSGCLS